MSYSSRVLQKLEGRKEIVFSSVEPKEEDDDTVDDYQANNSNKFLLVSTGVVRF